MEGVFYSAMNIAEMLKIDVDTVRYRIKILGIVHCYLGKAKENTNNCRFYSFEQFELIRNWKDYVGNDFDILPSRLNNTEIENL